MKVGATRSGPRSRRTSDLLDDPDDPADRGAEEDPDAVRRVGAVEPRVGDRLARGAEREEDVAVEPPRVLRRGDLGRVEVLHLRRDPHRELARVERADEVDAALAGDGRAPGRRRIGADRRHGAEPGHDHPPHPARLDARRRAGLRGYAVSATTASTRTA